MAYIYRIIAASVVTFIVCVIALVLVVLVQQSIDRSKTHGYCDQFSTEADCIKNCNCFWCDSVTNSTAMCLSGDNLINTICNVPIKGDKCIKDIAIILIISGIIIGLTICYAITMCCFGNKHDSETLSLLEIRERISGRVDRFSKKNMTYGHWLYTATDI